MAPLMILFLVWAVPAGVDAGFGDSIDAESPAFLQEIEAVGEKFELKKQPEIVEERLAELRTAKSELAIARALVRADEAIAGDENQQLRRTEVLSQVKTNLLSRNNSRAAEAVELALQRGRVYGQQVRGNNS